MVQRLNTKTNLQFVFAYAHGGGEEEGVHRVLHGERLSAELVQNALEQGAVHSRRVTFAGRIQRR